MQETKEKEVLILNLTLSVLALGALLIAGWTVATNMFKAGTDDLFLILVCLVLALLFAINPLIWAYNRGWIRNPFAGSDLAEEHVETHEEEIMDHAHGGSNRENVIVWGGLLFLTAVEVLLAYIHLNLTLMLIILMGLSIIKAALIIAYFMHLKFERLSFVLTVVPVLVLLFCLFSIFFPDSFRLHNLRPPGQEVPVSSAAEED